MSTLFEPGAPTPDDFIPLCIPHLQGNEWQYIKDCLDTGWVSSVGTYVDRFEQALATYVGPEYAVATSSGTAALHIALLVAGVQPDDEVLVSALTFIAPANAIRYVGAWPVFIDAEPQYWQMDPQRVIDFLENECHFIQGELRNKVTGRRVKAILPVHILGHPCNMVPILEVTKKFNLVVIEDATESLGTKYKGQKAGHLGDIACFSFNGNKIITSGGGGMIVTDNQAWAEKAKFLTTQAKDDPLEYVHSEIGYNYRLTNIQAAMGCAQLEQLDDYIAKKRHIAATYTNLLNDVPGLTVMPEASWAFSIFWLFTILVDETEFGMSSRELLTKLAEAKIQSRPLWQPLHQSTAYPNCTSFGGIVAERLNQTALSLPCSVSITDESINYIVANISQD